MEAIGHKALIRGIHDAIRERIDCEESPHYTLKVVGPCGGFHSMPPRTLIYVGERKHTMSVFYNDDSVDIVSHETPFYAGRDLRKYMKGKQAPQRVLLSHPDFVETVIKTIREYHGKRSQRRHTK